MQCSLKRPGDLRQHGQRAVRMEVEDGLGSVVFFLFTKGSGFESSECDRFLDKWLGPCHLSHERLFYGGWNDCRRSRYRL